MSLDSLFLSLPLHCALYSMAARMKVEDQCCKSKAVLGYDLFRPKRTAVTILSSPFLPEEAREKKDFLWVEGVHKMGRRRDLSGG